MGYDMYWKEPNAEILTLAATTRARFEELIKVEEGQRDEAAIAQAREVMDRANAVYFRLNVWGMGRCCNLMAQFGMLMFDYEMTGWPARPELKDDEYDAFDEWLYNQVEPKDGVPAEWVAYQKASEDALSAHPDPVTGICIHKLGSNDGWLVTPEECREALMRWREVCDEHGWAYDSVAWDKGDDGEDEKVAWWPEWLAYLAGAVDNGGFSVY